MADFSSTLLAHKQNNTKPSEVILLILFPKMLSWDSDQLSDLTDTLSIPLQKPKPDERLYPCNIWGPTCDGLDRIVEQSTLPDLQVGDWLLFENMGAYTVAASSTFNGFQRPDIHYVMSRTAW